VSYCLALNGPCVSTDTACSSSLVAAHLARRAVGVGDAAAGVAAGVNLALLHINTSVICAIGALSPVGRCKALDATADGYGRGEGCGVFVIGHAPAPRLLPGSGPAAAARVLVMVASAVNQDGRSSALTAPHGPSQQALLADIAREEAAATHSFSGGGGGGGSRFIAMHGTGTGLGDPIETGALVKSFLLGRGDNRAVLGAPKAHYGHTEGAAGVAGLLAAAGHLASAAPPPLKHLRNLNPFVASALESAGGAAPGAPRTKVMAPSSSAAASAATSSFGMSGVNAHAVMRIERSPSSASFTVVGRTYTARWAREAQRFAYFPCPHPLLNSWAPAAAAEEVFQLEFSGARQSYLHEHAVMGRALLPAAAALSAMAGAAPGAGGDPAAMLVIQGVALSAPLVLRPYGVVAASGVLPPTVELRRVGDVVRLVSSSSGRHTTHVTGFVGLPVVTSTPATATASGPASAASWGELVDSGGGTGGSGEGAHEGHGALAVARVQAPWREPGWADSEAVDAALHLGAAAAGAGGLPPGMFAAASIAACCFQPPAAAASLRGAAPPTAAARFARTGPADDTRSKLSHHSLVGGGGGGLLVAVNALVSKSIGGGAVWAPPVDSRAAAAAEGPGDGAERPVTLQHDVVWSALPGDTRADLAFAMPQLVGVFAASGAGGGGGYLRRSHRASSVSSDIAAALGAAQGAAAVRAAGMRVGTTGGAPGAAPPAAATSRARNEWAAAGAVRGAALHAIARTLAQEVPGLDAAAVDADPADATHPAAAGRSGPATASAGPVIAKAKRHLYGAALRGSTETLPTLHPSRDAADNDDGAATTVDPYAGAATASALITGGTGALGVQTGLWLVARGASRVTLTAGPSRGRTHSGVCLTASQCPCVTTGVLTTCNYARVLCVCVCVLVINSRLG